MRMKDGKSILHDVGKKHGISRTSLTYSKDLLTQDVMVPLAPDVEEIRQKEL
jgi:hypothetical protein